MSLYLGDTPIAVNSSSREIGEIIHSTIPLTDAGLHLLDGSVISGSGAYADFVTYIAGLVNTNPEIFAQGYISETTDGSAISGGDYTNQPMSNAFDGDTSTFWGSSQLGSSNIIGTAYIGRSGLTHPVKKVKMYQGYPSATTNYCSQLLFQYSNDGTTWIDIDTITDAADKTWQEWILPDYTPTGSTHSFRVLAYGGFSGNTSRNWIVDEIELYYFDTNSETVWQQSVTNYGACGKFVYDSANNTVRLPKRSSVHGDLIKTYTSGTDWYRIYSDGWCEQGGNLTISSGNAKTQVLLLVEYINTNYFVWLQDKGTNQDSYNGGVSIYASNFTNNSFYICPNTNNKNIYWQCCGYINISDLQQNPVYEYIVIATSVKTDIEVDIDEVMTDLNGKADVDLSNVLSNIDYVVESKSPTANDPTWYRVYKSGWVEQGGYCTGNYQYTITFLKPFANINYTPLVTLNYVHSGNICNYGCTNLTTTSMLINTSDGSQGNNRPLFWEAKGMGANQ